MRTITIFLTSLFLLSEAHALSCQDLPDLKKKVAEARGLDFKRHVDCHVLDRKTFEKIIKEQILRDYSMQSLEFEGLYLKLLGFIPENYDYSGCSVENALKNVSALYDYGPKGAVLIPDWIDTPEDILIHELVHALQDQNFDLENAHKSLCRTTDGCLALAAITEGDALITQRSFENKAQQNETEEAAIETETKCVVPETLDAQSFFPYGFGPIFVERIIKAGGTKALDEALRHMPLSTREVLHAADYSFRQGATFKVRKISVPEFLKDSRSVLVHRDVLGQYNIRLLLEGAVTKEEAILAAKGWSGDMLGLYKSKVDGKYSLLWKTAWNSEKDAAEFFDAMRELLQRQFGVQLNPKARNVRVRKPGTGSFQIRISGEEVEMNRGMDN